MTAKQSKRLKKTKTSKKSFRLRLPYQNFKGRNIPKLARTYHHELIHALLDLVQVNRKIQTSAVLSEKQIEYRALARKRHLMSLPSLVEHIQDTRYHLENFCFRAAAFRDKISQFVNQGLELGYPENTQNLINIMTNNGIYKKSRIETELKKFREDQDLKEILSMRIKIQHKTYYGHDYNPLFMPKELNMKEDLKKSIKSWRKNLIEEVSKADRFTTISIDMANKVVTKVSRYRIASRI